MGTVTVALARGITIGEKVYKRVHLRESTAGDLADAGDAANPQNWHAFNLALLPLIITGLSIDKNSAPETIIVTKEMLRRMSRADYNALTSGMLEADALGEGGAGDVPAS